MINLVGHWSGGKIWQITSGIVSSNSYFCEANTPLGGILIDPGLDGEEIEAEIANLGFYPTQVFCTHGHFDHIGSASYFQKKYGCNVFLHEADMKTLKSANNKILKKTISDLWEDLTANIILYPGHGGISDGASIRKHNHALRKFIELES